MRTRLFSPSANPASIAPEFRFLETCLIPALIFFVSTAVSSTSAPTTMPTPCVSRLPKRFLIHRANTARDTSCPCFRGRPSISSHSMDALRKLLKWPLRAALRLPAIRKRIAYELRRDYFDDLQVFIPLGHGIKCPIRRDEYVHSFSEIFLANEYGDFLDYIPLPRRWIDLGCHAGYFSAFLAWHSRRNNTDDFTALLVDADPRVKADVEFLARVNKLERRFTFLPGLIQAGAGEKPFGLRPGMTSSSELKTS